MIACPDCGLIEHLPALEHGSYAECALCGADLERTRGRSITAGLACALGTFIFLFPGNLALFLSVGIFGMHNQSRMGSGVFALWNSHWLLLALLTGAFAVLLPFFRFGLLSAVLGALRLGYRPSWVGPGYRWAMWLDVWAMPDVFLLASFVGYFRLIHVSQMTVSIHPGGYCFLAAAFLAMVSRASIDRRTIWRAIGPEADIPEGEEVLSCTTCDLVQPLSHEGKKCPRCGARLRARRPYAMMRATAFTVAAFVLFFPANIIPMNTTVQLGSTVNYTIFRGIRALFHAGLWPLGIIIFCTSIMIPALKIFGMGWCIASAWRGSQKHLVIKTKLFRFISEVGRWSNVDPFTLAIFIPLMTFSPFALSTAGWGATAFIAVVVLTLLASMTFDPRLMWDAAEKRRKT
jgi:paraquat-inducible protein A